MVTAETSSDVGRRILFVDAFDSFSNNIIGLLEQRLNAQVTLVHINDEEVNQNLEVFLDKFDAVVVGPGPGHPSVPSDVGFINRLWKLNNTHVLPVLGICLGFQCLCLSHGAAVQKLRRPRHGIVSRVSHVNTDIFADVGDCDATQYHSLHADLAQTFDDSGRSAGQVFWEPSEECPLLRPLAWDLSDEINGPVLMSVRHTAKPFWGVQFHPESICTSEAGKVLIERWWVQAGEWSSQRHRTKLNKEEDAKQRTSKLESITLGVVDNRTLINGNLAKVVALDAYPLDKNSLEGQMPHGCEPHVRLTNGHTTHGQTTNGYATNGHATNGTVTNGSATSGTVTNGSATSGTATNRHVTNGDLTNGDALKAHSTTGALANQSSPNWSPPIGYESNAYLTNGDTTNAHSPISQLLNGHQVDTNLESEEGTGKHLANQHPSNGTDASKGLTNGHATGKHALNEPSSNGHTADKHPPNGYLANGSESHLYPLDFRLSDVRSGDIALPHPRPTEVWQSIRLPADEDMTNQHRPNRYPTSGRQTRQKTVNGLGPSHLAQELRSIAGQGRVSLRWGKHASARITPTSLLEALGHSRDEVVLLDSQGHASGRYSILGLVIPGKTMKITYKVGDRLLRYGFGSGQESATHVDSIEDVWPILQGALDLHNPRSNENASRASSPGANIFPPGMDSYVAGHLPEESPFWGGFMGYISYEAGLETIDVDLHPSCASSGVPDINFAFIHRSIVIDHETSQVYIQSLLPSDWPWIMNVGGTIDGLACRAELAKSRQTVVPQPTSEELQERDALDAKLTTAQVDAPTEAVYRAKVLTCQESLCSGDSYELCLTDETEITMCANGAPSLDEWALYKRLRANNAAPFGAFVRLSDVVVIGTSPERFLSWTRDGRCQFRPIKGTVKKSTGMTRERAHAILGTSKERAENLMIVDLIRHDLSGVVGAANTWVSKLMVVEEYQSVYQLVSVIEGQLPSRARDGVGPSGIDVLKASLPPGSMTGAPKKRSCEILRDLERRPRGVYSGILGYMDVGGAGDFSVVIRTLVRGGGESSGGGSGRTPSGDPMTNGGRSYKANGEFMEGHAGQVETWRLGAGGAVTIQSTDEGEFLEMEVKASSVLGAILPRKKR